ncbi:hypothetical protein NMG60_11023723 [Bertholletia excelsa]
MNSSENFALPPPSPDINSFICFGNIGLQAFGFLSHCFRLGVLDITSVNISCFPYEILNLLFLRYLALGEFVDKLPPEISLLRSLETLIFHISVQCLELPESLKRMRNLRHICVRAPETVKGTCTLPSQEGITFRSLPFLLVNLKSLSWVDPKTCWDILRQNRNLKKLGVRGDMKNLWVFLHYRLLLLDRLENLKVSNASSGMSRLSLLDCPEKVFKASPGLSNFVARFANLEVSDASFGMSHKFKENQYDELRSVPIKFPQNIKKLTLENTYIKWDDLSTLGRSIPNLEVLKLLSDACIGLAWKTSRDFPKLKFLKFHFVKLMEWEVSSDDFPSLQRLVLVGCLELKMIPREIGEIPTLQVIEAHGCNRYVARSAWKIKEDQESMGNSGLQIIDYKNWWEGAKVYQLAQQDAISSSETEMEDEQ